MSSTRESVLINGYHEFQLAGSSAGGMGKVYFLHPKEKPEVHHTPMGRTLHPFVGGIAAKFPKTLSDSTAFERECRIWLDLRHRHIVPLLRLTEIGGQMAAIMPLYHQNLAELLAEGSDHVTGSFWYEQLIGICEGLDYAWKKHGLLHLDLKPQNILNFYKDRLPLLSIADWGMARFQEHCIARSISQEEGEVGIVSLSEYGGTLPYMSPERILGGLNQENYVHQISDDIFSLGVIIMEIATGINPCIHRCSTQSQVIDNIVTGRYFSVVESLSRTELGTLFALARDCCHPERRKRPTNYPKIIKRLKKYVV